MLKKLVIQNTLKIILFIVLLYAFCYQNILDLDSYKHFKRLIISCSILCIFLMLSNGLYRLLAIPFIFFWTVQYLSFMSSGEFLSQLTLENILEYKSLGLGLLLKNISVFCIISIYFTYLILSKSRIIFGHKYFGYVICLLFLVFITRYSVYTNFYHTIYNYYVQNIKTIENYNGQAFAKKFSSSFDHPYKDYNVILIFTEGLSKRAVSFDLMPNLAKLTETGLTFTDYFNHTAATFRGIRGQLISGYQRKGGFYQSEKGVGQMNLKQLKRVLNFNVESLPKLLNQHGYESTFISPHTCNNNLNLVAKLLGFNRIIEPCDLSAQDRDNLDNDPLQLSDQMVFEELKRTVKHASNSQHKFFISMYNIQTHHGMQVLEHPYKIDNEYYNKFHNYDFYLGEFVNWAENSGYLDNTLLIVTADHATYAVKLFEKAFNFISPTKSRFVDTIPLIIYNPTIRPQSLNAHGRNSLCLAPTILDMLGLNNLSTHFLGSSLFKPQQSSWETISIVNDVYVSTENGQISDLDSLDQDQLNFLNMFYSYESL